MFISAASRGAPVLPPPEPLPAGNLLGFYFINHLRHGLMGDMSSVLRLQNLSNVEVAHDPVSGNALINATDKNGKSAAFSYDAFDRKFRYGLSPTAYNSAVFFYHDAQNNITRLEAKQKTTELSVLEQRDLSIHKERIMRAAAPLTFYNLSV